MREIYRILDANFNRAREALRVAEDCGRFALNDPAVTSMAKNLRSDLREVLEGMPVEEMLSYRDTPGDIGTEITSPSEPSRKDLGDVAKAACKRLTEALRTIEEYSKVIAPERTVQVERMRYDAYTLEQRLIGRLNVRGRMEAVRLYVLVSSKLCGGSLRDCARSAIAGGADAIQLREKDVPDDQFLAMAAELRELTDETETIFIVNDRADIAAIIGADGVHLGQHDLPVAEARRLLRPGAIIGRSTHNISQATAAVNEGADYIAVGAMFPTTTKDTGPVAGPALLKEASEKISLPIVPIGGITPDNVAELVASGARRVAVCAAVCGNTDARAASEAIRKALPE
jgi:thiamine-phosphate pyrophosphorylase